MPIKYRDTSAQAEYLQVYLSELSGRTMTYSEKDGVYVPTYSEEIKVTGSYNLQTYRALCTYMVSNFPYEGFPDFWYIDDQGKVAKKPTMYLEKSDNGTLTLKVLNKGIYEDYNGSQDLLGDPKYLSDWISQNLSVFDIDVLDEYRQVVEVPDRVLSYILNEVVTPSSEDDEIFRVQKLLHESVQREDAGVYTDDLMRKIVDIQLKYCTKVNSGRPLGPIESGQFKGFKVTGYVDPWTELLIQRGETN